MNALKTIDRRQHCRENLAKLPKNSRAYVEMYRDQEIQFSAAGKAFAVNVADAASLRAAWLALRGDSNAMKAFASLPSVCQSKGGHGVDEMITGGSNSFFGSTSLELEREFTGQNREMQRRLERAMDELSKTGLQEELEAAEGTKKSRRRVFSDCEGEFHFERRWEDQPFSRMVKHRKDFPIVELLIPLANSGGIDAKSISLFGARCLALADVLEKAGYRVAITGENWSQTIKGQRVGSHAIVGMGSRFVMRSADSYGDLESIAQFVSAEFYRRCIFPLNYELAHYINGLNHEASIEYGYGMPYYDRPIATQPGQVYLTPKLMTDLFTADKHKAKAMFQDRIMWNLTCEANRAS
jgi:hypothetical protein